MIGVAGIIIQDVSSTVHTESYFETSTRRDPLGLAVVVPAQSIKQTLATLIDSQKDKKEAAKPSDEKK